MRRPRRVVFDFARACNMACPFCYVPFDGVLEHPAAPKRVLEILNAWEVESVTFGGGDPLMYDYLPELLSQFRASPSCRFVQLDTNGLLLTDARLRLIAPYLDLLGLPLDAVSEDGSWAMRRSRRHASTTLALLRSLHQGPLRVKVNTVVTAINLEELPRIANALAGFSIAMWSLYEYWPMPTRVAAFELEPGDFDAAVQRLRDLTPSLRIEASPIKDRWPGYFFVTPTGRAYTLDPADLNRYLELANLLEDANAAVSQWDRLGAHEANASRYLRRLQP